MNKDISNLKLSLLRALLGKVTNNLYAVTAAITDRIIKIHFYYDKNPSDDEKELADTTEAEVIADFYPEYEVKVECYSMDEKQPSRENNVIWIFLSA